jgi:hypothetical protein
VLLAEFGEDRRRIQENEFFVHTARGAADPGEPKRIRGREILQRESVCWVVYSKN